jgi:site-specific recombinase XerD
LSRDVIERFMDVTGFTRRPSPAERGGYRMDLYALESWMQRTTGHTLMGASTAELWAYFRRAIASGVEPRLLDRLLLSMQHFYAYTREAGFRDDDPAASMPKWVHKYVMPVMGTPRPPPVHASG